MPDSTISGCVVTMVTGCFHAESLRLLKGLQGLKSHACCYWLHTVFHSQMCLCCSPVQAHVCNTMHYNCAIDHVNVPIELSTLTMSLIMPYIAIHNNHHILLYCSLQLCSPHNAQHLLCLGVPRPINIPGEALA